MSWRTIEISDPEKLTRLEKFFPNYRTRPDGENPGGWMAGYEVKFRFSNGEHITIIVSGNPGIDCWYIGQGDLAIKGDFKAFVKELLAERS